MIKITFENKSINDLDSELLPFVQWTSVTLEDLKNAEPEIISKYLFKMSKTLQRSLIKSNRVVLPEMTNAEWYELIRENSYGSDNFFEMYQLPYSVIMYLYENYPSFNSRIAISQRNMPVQLSLECMPVQHITQVLFTGSNPGLIDFMFSPEGVEIIKRRDIARNIQYLKSTEAELLGIRQKNYNISPEVLRRAGACDNGVSYCRKILKELKVDKIKWDEAIDTIRASEKLQKRNSIKGYLDWITQRSSNVPE